MLIRSDNADTRFVATTLRNGPQDGRPAADDFSSLVAQHRQMSAGTQELAAQGTGSRGFDVSGTNATPDGHAVVAIDAGEGPSNIVVTDDGAGNITVRNYDNDAYTFHAGSGAEILINGGGGNDRIDASGTDGDYPLPEYGGTERSTYSITIEGGDGDDELIGGDGPCRLKGDQGNDYLEGGKGDDDLAGGDGKDVIYANSGNDALDGGKGRDYLDGGNGNDLGNGGADGDIVSGGRGDDWIMGGYGADVLITSYGHDTVSDSEDGTFDNVFAKKGDNVRLESDCEPQIIDPNKTHDGGKPLGSSVRIEGSDRFKDRMGSDVDTLAGLPDGQYMLGSLDASGHRTTIYEDPGSAYAKAAGGSRFSTRDENGNPGPGADAKIYISPALRELYPKANVNWSDTPPVFILFHEMAHAQDFVNGTDIPTHKESPNPGHQGHEVYESRERSATGLPFDQDGDPSTNEPNPRAAHENSLRAQLWWPKRRYY